MIHGIRTRLRSLSLLLALCCAAMSAAQAEGRIRISEQHGIVYVLLHIARDQNLIQKHGQALGQPIEVEWVRLSGGPAINDALLSGSIDIAAAGIGPLLNIWDKTRGKLDVRGVASLGSFPNYLISHNPKVRGIEDFTDRDRIALPAAGTSVQARILQLAAARKWGEANYRKLDALTLTLPHPDAAAAIISNSPDITAHFANSPFQEQELAANPNAHIVLNSNDVLGGPSSATVLYATERFRSRNPKTYAAFLAALQEAAQIARQDPEAATRAYLRATGASTDKALLLSVLTQPEVRYDLAPRNTHVLAHFMYRVGAIQNEPRSWQDYFFADDAVQGGS